MGTLMRGISIAATGCLAAFHIMFYPALADPPTIGGCQIFPRDNIWNRPITDLPVHANSNAYINTIGANVDLHPDFGTVWNGAPNGIPYVVVPGNQPTVNVSFLYDDESDPGPYPIPPNPPIEGGPNGTGDRHVLVIRQGECKLYELFNAFPQLDGSWTAGSGAIFDLNSNVLRPDTWTSADAAGLPMVPGLVRYEEVISGEIHHALRFTAALTQKAHIWPARHDASSSYDPTRPPMGQRFRLKANYDISGFSPEIQVILRALKTYGMMLADNGSNWYLSGAPNPLWDDDVLRELKTVTGSNFEAVDVSSVMLDPDSARATQSGDLNLDGRIDTLDLAIQMSQWGTCTQCSADLTNDNIVDAGDLSMLLQILE